MNFLFIVALNFFIILSGGQMEKRVGQQFEVKVSIKDAYNVIGLSANITYDPAVIRPVDTDDSVDDTQLQTVKYDFISNATLLAAVLKENGEEIPGTIVCGYAALPPAPASGSGDCFSITFEAIAPGTTNVVFDAVTTKVADENGDVPIGLENDVVDVTSQTTLVLTIME